MTFRTLAPLTLALACLFFAADARAEAPRAARIADSRGNLALRGAGEDEFSYVDRNTVITEGDTLWTDEDGRAEVELGGGSWVRLAEDTKVEFRRLLPDVELRLWSGSIYVDLSDRVEQAVQVRTPVGDVEVEADSVVRIDLGGEARARVTVWSGRARVSADRGEPLRLRGGERAYLEADRPAEGPVSFDRDVLDGFDRYHRERVDYYIDRPLPRYLDRDLPGARELNGYGSWVLLDDRYYWRPRCHPGWRPYSYGYWAFIPCFGYTWIDYAPWGYATCHFGRWLYRPIYGWLWCPGYVWSPAWVCWARYRTYCGWAPLDPFDRPCFYGPGSFSAFSLIIDLRGWTFCAFKDFYYGRHHLRLAGSTRPLLRGDEIAADRDGFELVKDVQREIGVPRWFVRGPAAGEDGVSARERVARLERRLPDHLRQLIEQRYGAKSDADIARERTDIASLQTRPAVRPDDVPVVKGDEARQLIEQRTRPVARGDRPRMGPGRAGPPAGEPRAGGEPPKAEPMPEPKVEPAPGSGLPRSDTRPVVRPGLSGEKPGSEPTRPDGGPRARPAPYPVTPGASGEEPPRFSRPVERFRPTPGADGRPGSPVDRDREFQRGGTGFGRPLEGTRPALRDERPRSLPGDGRPAPVPVPRSGGATDAPPPVYRDFPRPPAPGPSDTGSRPAPGNDERTRPAYRDFPSPGPTPLPSGSGTPGWSRPPVSGGIRGDDSSFRRGEPFSRGTTGLSRFGEPAGSGSRPSPFERGSSFSRPTPERSLPSDRGRTESRFSPPSGPDRSFSGGSSSRFGGRSENSGFRSFPKR